MTPKTSNQSMKRVRLKSGELATASAQEYRLPVYPVGRLPVPRVTDTKWGSVKVEKGHITARHRDLLDAISSVAERVVADASKNVHVLFDLVKVQTALGVSTDWRYIEKMLNDLVAVALSWRLPGTEFPAVFNILTNVSEAKTDAIRAKHQFQAKLKKVTFNCRYVELIECSTQLYLNKALTTQLLKLDHQVSRSVARWCFSHSTSQHHHLATVLEAVGAINSGEAIEGRASRRVVRKYKEQLAGDGIELEKLGVKITGTVLHYSRNMGAFIENGCLSGAPINAVNLEKVEGVAPLNAGVAQLNAAVAPLNAVA